MNAQNHMDASRKQLAWAWRALEFEDLPRRNGKGVGGDR